jgi:ribonuclease E
VEATAPTPAEAHVAAAQPTSDEEALSAQPSEAPAPPAAAASVAVPQAPATPVESVATPPAAPSRSVAGSTGSLFFTADADTPASVTRHLFDPVPRARPALQPAQSATPKEDMPRLADSDETEDGNSEDSERSA